MKTKKRRLRKKLTVYSLNLASEREAFSLLEVMVALSILAVGVMAVVSIYPSVMRQFRISRALTETALFAEKKYNQIKTFDERETESGTAEQGLAWNISFVEETVSPEIKLKKMILEITHPLLSEPEEFITYVE